MANELINEESKDFIIDIKNKMIKEEIKKQGKLPYIYTADRDNMEIAIHLLTEYEAQLDWYLDNKDNLNNKDNLRFDTFKLFNEALIEMLTSEKMTLKGAYITYAKVYDRLSEFIEVKDQYMTIGWIMDNAITDYINACGNTEIQNPMGYMKSVIWNCLQTGNISVSASIRKDFGY